MLNLSTLDIDATREAKRIQKTLSQQVLEQLRRRGLVVGLTGGIDSSVVAALAARALGADRVLGLFMPDRDSSSDSLRLGRMLATQLGIETQLEDITAPLEALGCYERQIEAVRHIFPEYGEGYRCRVGLPSILNGGRLSDYRLTIQTPSGETRTTRVTATSFRQVVAAANFKQRVRKTVEHYHADRLGFAVAGTPNRLEYDQGIFVKQGDGSADVKPIAHLYKTQVYALASALELPEEIQHRPATTDTFSLEQAHEELYFALPYDRMDLCLHGLNHGVPAEEVARSANLAIDQVKLIYADIASKRRATRYLHQPPLLVEPILEV